MIGPDDFDRALLDERGIKFVHLAITRENYRDVLTRFLTGGQGPRLLRQSFGRHVLAGDHGALPRDRRALYRHRRRALARLLFRQEHRARRRAPTTPCARRFWRRGGAKPGGVTAVSCCGANPGMVSWFVKQALLNLAADLGDKTPEPKTRERMGRARPAPWRQGHPYRRARHPARQDAQAASMFSSTPGRSRAFCPRACSRPSLAGARMRNGRRTTPAFTRSGCGAAIYLNQPGANTRVRSWTPTRAGAIRLSRHP